MITVWEIYRLIDEDDAGPANEHVRCYHYGRIEQALAHWKNAGGFSAGYGLRLALAKPEWLKREGESYKV